MFKKTLKKIKSQKKLHVFTGPDEGRNLPGSLRKKLAEGKMKMT